MPIATGVIGDLSVATLVTLRRVPSEGRSPADRDGPQGAVLLGGQGGAIACEIGGAILAHHVRHFEGGAVHTGLVQRQRIQGTGGRVEGMGGDMEVAAGRAQAPMAQQELDPPADPPLLRGDASRKLCRSNAGGWPSGGARPARRVRQIVYTALVVMGRVPGMAGKEPGLRFLLLPILP